MDFLVIRILFRIHKPISDSYIRIVKRSGRVVKVVDCGSADCGFESTLVSLVTYVRALA